MRAGLALLAGIAAGSVLSMIPAGAETSVSDNVITSITGTRDAGYRIRYGDESSRREPSVTVARAECLDGLDTEGRDAYLRCLATVRSDYRWMAAMRNTLNAKGVNR